MAPMPVMSCKDETCNCSTLESDARLMSWHRHEAQQLTAQVQRGERLDVEAVAAELRRLSEHHYDCPFADKSAVG